MIPSRATRVRVNAQTPWMLGRSTLSLVSFKCVGAHFQRDCKASKNTGKQSSPPGAGHRVVVEGLCTCQDSHLTGKPGAGQGSPLRVAKGAQKVWEGTPRPVHTSAESATSIARSFYFVCLRGRDECSLLGADTAPLHRVHSRLVSPGLELVVSFLTNAPTTSHHRVPAATAATADRLLSGCCLKGTGIWKITSGNMFPHSASVYNFSNNFAYFLHEGGHGS